MWNICGQFLVKMTITEPIILTSIISTDLDENKLLASPENLCDFAFITE